MEKGKKQRPISKILRFMSEAHSHHASFRRRSSCSNLGSGNSSNFDSKKRIFYFYCIGSEVSPRELDTRYLESLYVKVKKEK